MCLEPKATGSGLDWPLDGQKSMSKRLLNFPVGPADALSTSVNHFSAEKAYDGTPPFRGNGNLGGNSTRSDRLLLTTLTLEGKSSGTLLSQETDSIRAFAKWQRATQDVLSRPRG
jgi:hypothetical protein